MPNIKNDDNYVSSLTQTGLGDIEGLELSEVAGEGAEGARVENECSRTYDTGRGITGVMKSHLEATFGCMNDTSLFMLETDAQAAKNTTGGTGWKWKLGQ